MMKKAPETIETLRLVLRRPKRSDASNIFCRYASDPDVTKFLRWPKHQTTKDTIEFIKISDSEWNKWSVGPFLIFSKDNSLLLGSTGLALTTPTTDIAETGYVFAIDSWGKGYATEALQAMIELASSIGVKQLTALTHPDNLASQRVLLKCAFERQDDTQRPLQDAFPNLAACSNHGMSSSNDMQRLCCFSKTLS